MHNILYLQSGPLHPSNRCGWSALSLPINHGHQDWRTQLPSIPLDQTDHQQSASHSVFASPSLMYQDLVSISIASAGPALLALSHPFSSSSTHQRSIIERHPQKLIGNIEGRGVDAKKHYHIINLLAYHGDMASRLDIFGRSCTQGEDLDIYPLGYLLRRFA